jgi:hypothetical protein
MFETLWTGLKMVFINVFLPWRNGWLYYKWKP